MWKFGSTKLEMDMLTNKTIQFGDQKPNTPFRSGFVIIHKSRSLVHPVKAKGFKVDKTVDKAMKTSTGCNKMAPLATPSPLTRCITIRFLSMGIFVGECVCKQLYNITRTAKK